METTRDREQIKLIAQKIKLMGYDVYLSQSETYGFFCRQDGLKIICFQIRYFSVSFSSNHKGKGIGSGALIDERDMFNLGWLTCDFVTQLLNCNPYKSIHSGEVFYSWTNLTQHLETYQSSSKYTKL